MDVRSTEERATETDRERAFVASGCEIDHSLFAPHNLTIECKFTEGNLTLISVMVILKPF
jgi:hypothetical protein